MNGWTTLETGGTSYAMVDVRGLLADDLDRLPYVLRILAENCWRHQDAGAAEASVGALRAWGRGGEASIDVMPDRLLMHDTTSTPALVDLAAMRDVVARRGGDPASLVPVLPIEVSVDHSLAVEAYARPDAVAVNQALELRRNEERFAFLKWASGAMKGVSINPPGTGIMHTLNLEQFATVSTVLPGPDGVDGPVVAPDFMLGTDSHTPMVNGLGVLGWGIGGLEAELIMLGIPTSLRLPDVVGVRLGGALTAGASATDLALVVTERLRRLGVAGRRSTSRSSRPTRGRPACGGRTPTSRSTRRCWRSTWGRCAGARRGRSARRIGSTWPTCPRRCPWGTRVHRRGPTASRRSRWRWRPSRRARTRRTRGSSSPPACSRGGPASGG
jgi:aconitate hydratase